MKQKTMIFALINLNVDTFCMISLNVSLKRLLHELLMLMKFLDAIVTKWFTLTLYDDK